MLKAMQYFQRRDGQTLIFAYVVLIFLVILIAAFLSKAVNDHLLSRRQRLTQEVTYLAEGGIEQALYEIRDKKTVGDEPTTSPIITTYSAPFDTASISSTISQIGSTNRYEIVTTALHQSIGMILHQIVECNATSAFRYAVFYNRDLELLPGATMGFQGKIHSNYDIYIGADGTTLTIDSDYLYSAGDIYNKRKDNGTVPSGTVSIREYGTSNYPAMAGLDSDDANWTTESQTRWSGTVKSVDHGVGQLAVPEVKSIQPDGYYANQADLKIEVDADGDIVITEGGSVIHQGAGEELPGGTITDTDTFYNNREGKTVKMVNIDMRKLAGYDEGDVTPTFDNHLPANGLIYSTRLDTMGAGQQQGVRLVNGQTIERSGGLTVVTNQPLYIEGDYNNPAVFADREPCAVITDSLNLLSNDWADAKSLNADCDTRIATATAINTAFIAGIDDTDPDTGHYNGGLENYPRMHERWSGVNLNINGAFLALWKSEIAQGAWVYGDPQYKAPIRNWAYDTLFLSQDPPEPAQVVTIEKVAWWKE